MHAAQPALMIYCVMGDEAGPWWRVRFLHSSLLCLCTFAVVSKLLQMYYV